MKNRLFAVSLSVAASFAVLGGMSAGCGGSSSQAPAASQPTNATGADPSAATLPEASQVLEAYVTATGGRAAYQALESRVMKGSFEMPTMGIKGTLETYQAAPQKMLLVVELPGLGVIKTGTDGTVAWSTNVATGNRVLEGAERAKALRDAQLHAEILWDKLFTKVETVGAEKVGDADTYKVAMTTPEGEVEYRFYDQASGLLLRSESVQKSPEGEIASVQTYSDYRDVGGIKVAHRVDIEAMGQSQVIQVTSIEHNVSVPADRFAIPAEIQALQSSSAPTK